MSVEVYINMNSGRNLRDKFRIHRVSKIVGDNGHVFGTKSVDQLELIMEDISKRRPKSVILSTGDGGVCTFVSLLVKYWPEAEALPSIALLRGGSFEFLAKQCNVPKKKKRVKTYLEQIIKEEGIYLQDIDFMRIKDDRGVEGYGFNFGVGAVVTLIEEIYKRKTWKWAGVAFVLSKLYLSMKSNGPYYQMFNKKTPLEITIGSGDDMQKYGGDYLALMAQTIKSIGLRGSETFYKAQESVGQFHARGATDDTKEVMRAKNLAKIYSGSIFGNPDCQTNLMHISSAVPFRYQISGELSRRVNSHTLPYEANNVEVRGIIDPKGKRQEQGVTLKIIKAKSAE